MSLFKLGTVDLTYVKVKINISIILKICSKQKTDMLLHLMNMGFVC